MAPALMNFTRLQKRGCHKWSKCIKNQSLSMKNIHKREAKWEDRLNIRNKSLDWGHLYSLNMNINFCNKLRFFHLCLLKDNLETNTRSVHYRTETNLCTFCNLLPETCIHMLWECTLVQNIRKVIFENIASTPHKNKI